jgi:uncharacterized membrane protein
VNGRILWANLHLLFWLSLTPFAMGWMGANTAAAAPAAYGTVLLGSGIAYLILQREILAARGPHFRLRAALGRDLKGKISAVLCIAASPSPSKTRGSVRSSSSLMWLHARIGDWRWGSGQG